MTQARIGARGQPAPFSFRGRSPSTMSSQAFPVLDLPLDPAALAALNERFRPRFEALWAAMQATLAQPGSVLPDIVPTPKHDRRFASAPWREQPYFAYLKQ